jgi:hypothetical protein
MLTPSELKSKYIQAMEKQPANDDDDESVYVLWQNDWVRILTVRDLNTPDLWRIEVEVSLPVGKDPEPGKDVEDFIQHLIRHLEYLLSLADEGLALSVMSRDNLWTASLELKDIPQDKVFKALIPPSP